MAISAGMTAKTSYRLHRRAFLALSGAAACFPSAAQAAPRADLWPRWEAHDPASILKADHTLWDDLLTDFTQLPADGIARFDYAAARREGIGPLNRYIASLSGIAVSALNRREQFAYWVNLYNALTVKVVLDHYPVDSIRDIDISPGLFSSGPWGAKLIKIEGEALTLDDIEHRILRPIWRDPRIHYAVNCASLGCPNLQGQAFSAENTEELLEAGARAYVNHPRGARANGRRLRVSSIYVWFQEDFGGSEAGVIQHLGRYAQGDLAEALAYIGEIASHDYDWRLNSP